MGTAELKSHLHELIDETSDNSVLRKIFTLLSDSTPHDDWWDHLTDESKEKTHKSVGQSKNGEVVSHEIAKQRLAKKFPDLKF